jgi:hypothetical protein
VAKSRLIPAQGIQEDTSSKKYWWINQRSHGSMSIWKQCEPGIDKIIRIKIIDGVDNNTFIMKDMLFC